MTWAPPPEVIQRLDGYEAILRFGDATLSIARLEAPVPSGSDVKDAGFRTAQQGFYDHPGPAAHEQAILIGGHDAWTSSSVRKMTPEGSASYTFVAYTIVDQHLYRLVASSTEAQTRPPEFDAAVRAISEMTFVPVLRPSVPGTSARTGLLKPPRLLHFHNNRDWYPAAARRRREEGEVDLEFSVDRNGHARDVRQISSASRTLMFNIDRGGHARDLREISSASGSFDEDARELLESAVFAVTPGWDDAHERARFTIDIQFALSVDGRPCSDLPSPTLGTMVATATICTSTR
jgi:hypothetical protein